MLTQLLWQSECGMMTGKNPLIHSPQCIMKFAARTVCWLVNISLFWEYIYILGAGPPPLRSHLMVHYSYSFPRFAKLANANPAYDPAGESRVNNSSEVPLFGC